MKAEQRDGIEYEFTTVLDLTHDIYCCRKKRPIRLFLDPRQLGEHDGVLLKQWLLSDLQMPVLMEINI